MRQFKIGDFVRFKERSYFGREIGQVSKGEVTIPDNDVVSLYVTWPDGGSCLGMVDQFEHISPLELLALEAE